MDSLAPPVETDVLVIGGGIGGMRAAIGACDGGARVLLLTKGALGRDGAASWMALGSFLAAVDPNDSVESHVKDTIVAGKFINNQRLVYALLKHGPQMVEELERWGFGLLKKNGKYVQNMLPGLSFPRSCRTVRRNSLGTENRNIITRQVRNRKIDILEDCYAADLMLNNSRVAGALCIDLRQGCLRPIVAKATVLATGGYSACYELYTGNRTLIGDGHALAYRAGAKLMDMEFVQFHPTALVFPSKLAGTLVYDFVVELRGIFYNSLGERFMERCYPDKKEFVQREAQARAIFREVKEGRGSSHGGVYLSLRHLPRNLIDEFIIKSGRERLWDELKAGGIDLYRDGVEVYPASHYPCGGLWIDEKCQTSLKGLYGAGEVGSGSKDGADRLAGNAVTFAYTMGIVAGRETAAEAQQAGLPYIEKEQLKELEKRILAPVKRVGKIRPHELKSKVRRIMSSYAFFGRSKEGLEKGIREIEQIKETDLPGLYSDSKVLRMNADWVDALEAMNMTEVAEAVLRAALIRSESRGLHEREDYPKQDPQWLQHIIIKNEKGKMVIDLEPVADFPYVQPV